MKCNRCNINIKPNNTGLCDDCNAIEEQEYLEYCKAMEEEAKEEIAELLDMDIDEVYG